jgi:hypothetical protein
MCLGVWSELERCQPFQPGYDWLGRLNKVNNESKHDALVPQTKQELGSGVQMETAEGSSVSWSTHSVHFGRGVSIGGIPVDSLTQMPVPDPRIRVTKTVWVDFQFEGVGVSAIGLLRRAIRGVRAIISALAPLLWS